MNALLITPERRARWDRLRTENHPYYKAVLAGGLLDNTTGARYASSGRWSALAVLMSHDSSFSRRSYDHVKNAQLGKTFETAAVMDGNRLREYGIEFVVTLSWIYRDLSEAEVNAWRDWLFRTADATLAGSIRMNDSDQVVGTYFYLACLDRVFGSTYLQHPKSVQMREAIWKFCAVLAKGGQWPEGGEYSLGTMNLLFTGAEAAGIEDYQDVVTFRDEVIRYLPHTFTPDLKDTFEHGDDQTRHDPHWLNLETVLAYLGQYSPEIRQFEADLRAVWNRPAGTPLYPRYFVWADPSGPLAPWKPMAGTYAVAHGVGQVYSRQSWDPAAEAVQMWFPPYSLGVLDHAYGIFGEIRVRKGGQWTRDRPIAYSGALLLGNHTIIGGLSAPKEVGVFTGATRLGHVTYGSGTNAGVFAATGRYQPPPTLLNEKSVSFICLMDRGVILKIERIHLTDTVDLARFAETADKAKIAAAPLIESIWQSQTVMPTVANGVITDDGRVQPLYPCTIKVVDEDPLSLGSIAVQEKGWYSSVIPTSVAKFHVLVTLLGEADVTVEPLGDVQRIRVKKAGHRDAVVYSSAKAGPVLTTTRVGSVAAPDPTKIAGILAARAVTVDPAWAEVGADVYVEQADGLQQLAPPVQPQDPTATDLRAALVEIQRLAAAALR
jgi:hypothetical protein